MNMFTLCFRAFVRQLAWPAVAANVLWSITSLLVTQSSNATLLPRLLVLGLLLLYVFLESSRSGVSDSENATVPYLLVELLMAVAMIWVALAVYLDQGHPGRALCILLSISAMTHLFRMWNPLSSRMLGVFTLLVAGALFAYWYQWHEWNYFLAQPALIMVMAVFAFRFPLRSSMQGRQSDIESQPRHN